mmetsp:Transcript_47865/g.152717  ORF Transcript_47865/g.152717 Transcript_47865/m.152717 type:complete len:286 (+) Transcript_47865:224-1081(+)
MHGRHGLRGDCEDCDRRALHRALGRQGPRAGQPAEAGGVGQADAAAQHRRGGGPAVLQAEDRRQRQQQQQRAPALLRDVAARGRGHREDVRRARGEKHHGGQGRLPDGRHGPCGLHEEVPGTGRRGLRCVARQGLLQGRVGGGLPQGALQRPRRCDVPQHDAQVGGLRHPPRHEHHGRQGRPPDASFRHRGLQEGLQGARRRGLRGLAQHGLPQEPVAPGLPRGPLRGPRGHDVPQHAREGQRLELDAGQVRARQRRVHQDVQRAVGCQRGPVLVARPYGTRRGV